MALSDSLKSLEKDKLTFTIISILIVFIIIAVIYKVYSVVKTGSELAAQQLGEAIVAKQTGVQVTRQDACHQIANACENAVGWMPKWIPLVGGDFYSISGDAIVQALNQCTSDDETGLVSLYFRNDTGVTLKAVVDSWHSGIDKTQLQYYSSIN